MQIHKLSCGQRDHKRWENRRNSLIGKILAENPSMLRREGIAIARKILHASTRGKKGNAYKHRDRTVEVLGFDSYKEYLKSEEWVLLRSQQLRREPDCCLCKNSANQVHHFSYEREVLLGAVPELLFSICGDCHQKIEFDGSSKRTLVQTQQHLLAWFAVHDKPMADRILAARSGVRKTGSKKLRRV